MVTVLKTVGCKKPRGFESHPLRHIVDKDKIDMSLINREFYKCDYCGKEIDRRNLKDVFQPEGWRIITHGDFLSGWVKELHMCDKCCKEDRYRTLLEKNKVRL
jgi:hypothetical protein